MYDKTVRRRRVVLGLLVASSLILLTAYFGESAGGGLHSVQRGVLDVVSPIQEGASRALKPVRDLFGWAGDTVNAKGELKDLRKDRDALRAQNIQLQAKLREEGQLGDQAALNKLHGLTDNRPVAAHVIGQDPNLWFTQVTIDQGTSSGVNVNQAVVNGAGLVGKVTWVSPGTSIVTLTTDHTTQIGATVSESGVKGIVQVEAGHPTDLVLGSLSGKDVVRPGQTVVTSGTVSNVGKFPSPYPREIPIGRVTRVDDAGSDNQQVHVAPFVNGRRLDLVEVLTKGDVGPVRVAVPQLVLRLALVGIVTVLLQVSAVTQLQLFGTNADLMPLVIAAVGLLAGSVAGACFGFAAGLFLDLALVQTVGLSSLVYVAVGYWAGRFRELRDPQSALVPLAVGAAATAAAMIGYSLMQFLLGVDAPVSFLLAREILATVLLNGVIATPVYAVVRRVLLPALPEDPRRRRRRAYTTGGLSPLSRA